MLAENLVAWGLLIYSPKNVPKKNPNITNDSLTYKMVPMILSPKLTTVQEKLDQNIKPMGRHDASTIHNYSTEKKQTWYAWHTRAVLCGTVQLAQDW